MTKCLVIGDTHYDNQYHGYLDKQLETTLKLVDQYKPKIVIFLGDIFHQRKPHPEVVVKVQKAFQKLQLTSGLTNIYILRGNHDSINKSDDGSTILDVLDWPGSKVTIIKHTYYSEELEFLFIPHYENEEKIKEDLGKSRGGVQILFGHFGFSGCICSTGFFDFSIEALFLKEKTILGHIHRYLKQDNITILGTPWSTNFGESDYDHFVGILERVDEKWGELQLHKVDYGVRHFSCPYPSLNLLKDEICNDKFFTLLRVYLDKFLDENTNLIRSEIVSNFKVGYVDFKFQPTLDKKLNNRLSDYSPNVPLNTIDDTIINKYIEEQASSIPKEKLEETLTMIRNHEDTIS